MSSVSDALSSMMGNSQVNDAAKNKKTTQKTTQEYGKTFGDVELSDKAKDYYKELRQKYSDMDFVIVSKDKKEEAKANLQNFGNANKMVVVIGEDEVEAMANDQSMRNKYEGIIEMARQASSTLSKAAEGNSDIISYGITTDKDGNTSFFAVMNKANQSASEKTAEIREKRKERAKEAEKLEEKRSAKAEADEKRKISKEDTEVLTSSTLEGLLKKINDFTIQKRTANVETDEEKMLGRSIDFTV